MWLHLHHRVYFSQHGETVRSNLVPLCSRCHSNVHKGLLRISGNADGTLSFTTAEGVSLEDAHLLDVADWLNFWLGWTGDEGDRHQPPDLSAA
jgi:5-methylcytosine-specific restriction endonuclease McrA